MLPARSRPHSTRGLNWSAVAMAPCGHPQNSGEQQEEIMGKGNNSQKKETKKPKKDSSKKAAKESKK